VLPLSFDYLLPESALLIEGGFHLPPEGRYDLNGKS
jgi:hypothetical protein